MSAHLHRITIYPIKSLDGVALGEGAVLPTGALANDRRYALVDEDGRFVNGKRTAAVHQVRAEYDLTADVVKLRTSGGDSRREFSLTEDRVEIANWLSAAIGTDCQLCENSEAGFPDDTDAPGPTVVSKAALQEVASWFGNLTLDEVRRRFRANFEIADVPPFWEDRLVGPHGSEVPFQIGNVRWLGVNACQRCVVPTRASETGELTPRFQKNLAERREAALPAWATAARFDHFFRFAVNTRLAPEQPSCTVRVGDPVQLG